MKSTIVSVLGMALAIAVAIPGIAEAKKAARKDDGAIQATTAAAFAEQAADVRKEMKPGGRYTEITVEERARVEKNLDVITRLFEEKPELASMSDRQKIELLNAQEDANTILTKNDDDRLICKMERPTGSNFKQKQCMTAKQAREARERARDGIDRYSRPNESKELANRPRAQ